MATGDHEMAGIGDLYQKWRRLVELRKHEEKERRESG